MQISNMLSMFKHENITPVTDSLLEKKYQRVARNGLCDLILFHQKLHEEIETLLAVAVAGQEIDHRLLEVLQQTQESYERCLPAFCQPDDNILRNTLIAFGDNVHELMLCMHKHGQTLENAHPLLLEAQKAWLDAAHHLQNTHVLRCARQCIASYGTDVHAVSLMTAYNDNGLLH